MSRDRKLRAHLDARKGTAAITDGYRKARAPPRKSGLAGKPFIYQVRLDFPCKRSGHEGVQDAVQPAWNDFGAVFDQTAEGLRYALLDAHRFHRHRVRFAAELFEHRAVPKRTCQSPD